MLASVSAFLFLATRKTQHAATSSTDADGDFSMRPAAAAASGASSSRAPVSGSGSSSSCKPQKVVVRFVPRRKLRERPRDRKLLKRPNSRNPRQHPLVLLIPRHPRGKARGRKLLLSENMRKRPWPGSACAHKLVREFTQHPERERALGLQFNLRVKVIASDSHNVGRGKTRRGRRR